MSNKGGDDIIKVNQLFTDLNTTLNNHADILDHAADSYSKFNKNFTNFAPSDYIKQLEKAKTAQEELIGSQGKLAQENAKMIDSLMKEIEALKKKADTQKGNKKLTDEEIINARVLRTEKNRNATITASETNAYEKLNAQLNLNIRMAQGMAVQMYNLEVAGKKGTLEYNSLSTTLDKTQKEIQQTDAVLKAVDASMGRNQRNIGNYKSTWNGLGNSINQITRELPAFTFSAQTGFLAISNNLPMLFDEIQKINVELTAIKVAAQSANEQLILQTEIQLEAAVAAENAAMKLVLETDAIVANTAATAEQAAEIRALILAQIEEATTTGVITEATLLKTEAILASVGASAEQIAVIKAETISTQQSVQAHIAATVSLEAQAVATATANTVAAATPGIMSRIASSLFSLNGLLVAGTLVLTLYGKEIVNWIGEMFGASEAMKALEEGQKKLNEARLTGAQSAVKDAVQMKEWLNIAKDEKLSYAEREIAMKKLRSTYPFYFKDLKDSAILAGQTAEAEMKLRMALDRRGEAQKKTDVIVKNKERLLAIADEEVKAQKELLKVQTALDDISKNVTSGAGQGASGFLMEQSKLSQKLNALEEEKTGILKQNAAEEDKILTLRKQSIWLDYQEDKSNKERLELMKENTKANKDYSASEFEIVKLQLQNQIKYNEAIMNDDTKSFDIRKKASLDYFQFKTELSELEYKEEIRLNEFKLTEDLRVVKAELANSLAKNREDLANKKGAIDRSGEYIRDAQAKEDGLIKESGDRAIISYIKVADRRKEIAEETLRALREVEEKIAAGVTKNDISQEQLDNIRQVNLHMQNITTASSAEDFKKIEDLKLEIANSSSRKMIELEQRTVSRQLEVYETAYEDRVKLENQLRALLDKPGPITRQDSEEIDRIKKALEENLKSYDKNSEAYNELIAKKRQLDIDYENSKQAEHERELARIKELKAATDDYIKGFANSFLSSSGLGGLGIFFDQTLDEVDGKMKSTFDRLMEGAGTAREKFQVAFLAISTVVMQAFELMNASSAQYYENQEARAQRDYETAIEFAGNSAVAKAEIERQYEAKRRAIARAKAKEEKDTRLFQAIMGTAQAVVAALPNIGLSILVGALGAIQIATIAGQPLPAYKDGTPEGGHVGGPMLINDAKGPRFRETVVTPSGRVYKPQGRNIIATAPKGTKVYTDEQWAYRNSLNALLAKNDIAPVSNVMYGNMESAGNNPGAGNGGGGFSASEFNDIMTNQMSKIKINHFSFDENGFTHSIIDKNQKTIDASNRASSIPNFV